MRPCYYMVLGRNPSLYLDLLFFMFNRKYNAQMMHMMGKS